jgi:hypothetical protein
MASEEKHQILEKDIKDVVDKMVAILDTAKKLLSGIKYHFNFKKV